MPASASAATSFGWVDGSSLTQARAEVSRYSAIPPSCDQAGERAVGAVHVVAGPAGAAQPAGRRRVQDHRVADGHVGDRRSRPRAPSRRSRGRGVGQRRAHRRVPLALDDVQVGAADAGAADLHDDVERAADRRLGHLVDDGLLVVTRATGRPSLAPPRLVSWLRVVPVPQHAAADAAVRLDADPGQPGPAQVQRQRVGAHRRAGRRVDQQRRVVAGGQAQLGPALRAAGPAPATAAPRPASAPAAPAGSVPAASSGRHTWSVPASTALRRKSARSSSSSPTASPSNDAAKPGPRGHPAVDRVGGEVVLEHHLGRCARPAPR